MKQHKQKSMFENIFKMPKANMNFSMKNFKFPSIFKDSDHDGYPDIIDCEPHNPKKQGALGNPVKITIRDASGNIKSVTTQQVTGRQAQTLTPKTSSGGSFKIGTPVNVHQLEERAPTNPHLISRTVKGMSSTNPLVRAQSMATMGQITQRAAQQQSQQQAQTQQQAQQQNITSKSHAYQMGQKLGEQAIKQQKTFPTPAPQLTPPRPFPPEYPPRLPENPNLPSWMRYHPMPIPLKGRPYIKRRD